MGRPAFVSSAILTGCSLAEGKKTVTVIVHNGFRTEKFAGPKHLSKTAGYQVTIATPSREEVRGILGGRASSQSLLKDAKVLDHEAMIFAGWIGD